MAVGKQHFLNMILNRRTQMLEDSEVEHIIYDSKLSTAKKKRKRKKRHVATGQQEKWGEIRCQNKLYSAHRSKNKTKHQ